MRRSVDVYTEIHNLNFLLDMKKKFRLFYQVPLASLIQYPETHNMSYKSK